MTRSLLAALVLGAAVIPACDRPELSGPPSIRLGSDECAGCGMLVSEGRCSCAMLVEEEGRRTYLVFDDLGCMLDYGAKHPTTSVVDTFVHDYATAAWVQASSALYLIRSPNQVATPMGSGLVAFASRDAAEAQRRASGGDIVGFETLADARRDWRDTRTLHPGGAP